MTTKIIKPDNDGILLAKNVLLSGGVIGMPTETVYGLAGDGTNSSAVKKIFEVKGRPSDNPLIAHVHKDYDLNKLVLIDQPYVGKIIDTFMPGPITLVLKSRGVVCSEAVCGGDTLAVRMPSHKDAQNLLKEVNLPIVAPSANLSKHTSPVSAEHVYFDLNGKIPLILDGGKCMGGIESTVLDCTAKVPRILRAGLITKEMIESLGYGCEIAEHKSTDKVKSPGVKYKHYKPNCETALFYPDQKQEIISFYKSCEKQGKNPYIMCADYEEGFEGLNKLLLGNTPNEIASNLYDRLLYGEKVAGIIIAVAMPDEKGVNLGIMNRMKKSCGV